MSKILPTYLRKGNSEFMSWEPMSNVPAESGHYAVGHRGRVFGTAYYNSGDVPSLPKGWSQIPSCCPSHWLNSSYDIEYLGEDHMRIWSDWPNIGPSRFTLNEFKLFAKRAGFFARLMFIFTGKIKI